MWTATLTRFMLLAISVLVTLTLADSPAYDFDLFRDKIDGECLSKLWTVPGSENTIQPTGQTLESFVAMVEKVEAIHSDWNIYEVSRALLKRFAFEEMVFSYYGSVRRGMQSIAFTPRWNVMSKLLGEDTTSKVLDEDDLSEEEKCTMFFMMGHLVNDTYREGIDEEMSSRNDVPLDGPNADVPDPPGVLNAPAGKVVAKPREQGVVSVRGSMTQAISISKVLNGLLASQYDDQSVNQIYNIGLQEDLKINPVLGVTLGDVVSEATLKYDVNSKPTGARFFGPGGIWNSTACPTEFALNEMPVGVTNALVRGAVDGVLISRAVSNLGADTEGLRLSRVLRMYYSPKGITEGGNDGRPLSYCRRKHVLELLGTEDVHKSVLTYCTVLSKLSAGFLGCQSEKVLEAVQQLGDALSQMQDESGTEECKGYEVQGEGSQGQPTCETPANVFVVLDTSETGSGGFMSQEEIVGFLASKLDFGRGVGSLNVYYDSKGKDGKGLLGIRTNATDSTCAACELVRLDREDRGFPQKADSEVVILDGLNKTLQEFEQVYDLEAGVPSKVAVMFQYEQVKETNERRLIGSRNILRDGHRDTRMFVVTSPDIAKEALSVLADGPGNVVTDNRNTELTANELVKRICRVPAIFQYNRCFDHKKASRNEDHNVYTGYITENHVQFWAFYPEYFLKSYNMKIKFFSMNGNIVVCEKRGVENPGYKADKFDKEGCKATDDNSQSVEFTFSNPCEGYHVHNCPSINFAIVGQKANPSKFDCPVNDDKCRRFDQIKFQVSHEGIFCSGSDYVKSSLSMIMVATVVFLLRKSLN